MEDTAVKNKYFPFQKYGHVCTVTDDVDPVKLCTIQKEKWSIPVEFYHRIVVVSENNMKACKVFHSNFAMDKEKIRHLLYHPHMIHPYSCLRAWWENIMIFVLFLTLIWSPLDMALIDVAPRDMDNLDVFRLLLDTFLIIDIVLCFFTGIQRREDNQACLEPSTIAWNYAKGCLIVDLLSSFPAKAIIKMATKYDNVSYDVCEVLKICRIFTLIRYMNNLMDRLEMKVIACRLVRISIVILLYIHWVTCLQFTVTYMTEHTHTPIHPDPSSWMTYHKLWNASLLDQYLVGFSRAASMISLQGLGRDFPIVGEEQLFVACVWIVSMIVNITALSIILSIIQGVTSSKSKYYIMTNQLRAYMAKKELPQQMQQKMLKFYQTKYQKSYFRESDIVNWVSGHLRQDVMMHSCRQVVNDVPFLRHLPDNLLLRIVSSLRSEIFLPNDIIIKIDTIGECMYFIVYGTVAIYSAGGRELCHLRDGAHFGEVSLMCGGMRRTATVAAVSVCELFRLDAADFTRAIAPYPELLASIASIAADRLEKTEEADTGGR